MNQSCPNTKLMIKLKNEFNLNYIDEIHDSLLRIPMPKFIIGNHELR